VFLAACGGGSSGGSPAPSTTDQPATINLYPNEASSAGVPRLTVMLTAVGSSTVNMPLIFDTGSAGVALLATGLFPSSILTSSGFVFPSGQTSITYNGITVMDQQGTRAYGLQGVSEVALNGNIGYAQLSFGDAQGELTTAVMPVFLYYSITDTTTNTTLAATAYQQGLFGVAPSAGEIVLPSSVAPQGGYPACAQDTDSTCFVVSPLKYLQYGPGLNAGFLLTPAALQSCDITTAGSCSGAPMLKVGLTAALESGFSATSLVCPESGVGPSTIAGFLPCDKTIDDNTINISGPVSAGIAGSIVFDTGTSRMIIAAPVAALAVISLPAVLPEGSTVLIGTPSGFTYSYQSTSSDPFYTSVYAGYTGPSIVGIGYLTTNSLYIDFSSSTEGWK